MFISIVGTRRAGKSTVENFLVSKLGFIRMRLSTGEPALAQNVRTRLPVSWLLSETVNPAKIR
jgi:hypothetical protein